MTKVLAHRSIKGSILFELCVFCHGGVQEGQLDRGAKEKQRCNSPNLRLRRISSLCLVCYDHMFISMTSSPPSQRKLVETTLSVECATTEMVNPIPCMTSRFQPLAPITLVGRLVSRTWAVGMDALLRFYYNVLLLTLTANGSNYCRNPSSSNIAPQ